MYTCCTCLLNYVFFLIIRRPPRYTRTDTLFPYTTLFRSAGVILIEFVGVYSKTFQQNGKELGFQGTYRDMPAVPAGVTAIKRCAAVQQIGMPLILPLACGQEGIKQANERSEERRVGKECVSPCRSRWSPYH